MSAVRHLPEQERVPSAGPSDPCPCGSGLRRVRCCSLDPALLVMAPPKADGSLPFLVLEAQEAHRSGNATAAERASLEGLELFPGQLELLLLLSRLRADQNRSGTVEVLLRRIVALDPNALDATLDLGLHLLQRGALADAEVPARNAVRIAPGDGRAHHLLGMVLTEAQQPVAGEYHYRRALDLMEARPPIVLANLAWCLKLQGRMEEGRALYAESLAAAPDVFQSLLGWARLEEADRDLARAADLLDRAEEVLPNHPGAVLLRAVLHGRAGNAAAAVAVLDRLASDRLASDRPALDGVSDAGSVDSGLTVEELLEKGRLLDRMSRHDEAFAAFGIAKRRVQQLTGQAYQAELARRLAERLQSFFVAGRLSTLPRAAVRPELPQPVFVLGFPRSGTTLVEQTLSAHPMIDAGDELPFVAEIAEALPRLLGSPLSYPDALSELWMGDGRDALDILRDDYLRRVRQRRIPSPGTSMFTDKMPLNEFHLGLIALMFPAAPLVHVLRHPLDVVLSVFSNQLTHGFHCASALESTARHYALVSDLVAHYRSEMALRYLPVRYEDLVTDQEREVRRVLQFLGLKFDPACLRFHENRRYARTASYAQVAEPLYDRSRGRWRQYRRHLAPVMPILMPAIERLGYDVA